ncbi:signal recognition particle 19 kDa protein-like [Symsagittifera roscoffensis]|uniref:signal recognition particle 19 kDa protein-like n=1 Tax=Symsagittifera roscoffensis TaxID=84072 RepID=UPI00307BB9C6
MAQSSAEPLSDNTNIYYLDPTRRNYIFIYPQYLNSKRTCKQGRKTCKNFSVDNPTAQEIRDICLEFGFEARLEPKKRYPQDPDCDPNHIGRVRVKLKNEDGSFCKAEYDTKMKILNLCGQSIPKLKSRTQKPSGGGGGAAAASANQNQDQASSANTKEKGKKKGNRKR